jgi:sRNA-binding regulator protein Hfq
MGHLEGLPEYLDEAYSRSIFDEAQSSGEGLVLHLHGRRTIRAAILENLKFDIKVRTEQGQNEKIPKIQVKLLYPEAYASKVNPLIKIDKKIEALKLEQILAPGKRFHVKNKTLFPLMKEKQVLFFTLLEGEIIRGIVSGFSRYEIAMGLKGGVPITVMRHAIYDMRDKKGRCFLKKTQEKHRDWEKSPFFVESEEGQ